MSLVGTRPPTVDEWDKYELHHRARLATKPGLTGMWQVSGRSNITDFHHIIQSSVFIVNIAWMNHTVNKATVKGIKKETDMILAEGTGITAIRNKGIRIRRIKRNIKIRTVCWLFCQDGC